MTDTTTPAEVSVPVADAPSLEPAAPAEPESAAPSEETTADAEKKAAAAKTDWVDRRVTRLAEQKAAARAQAEIAQRRAAELEARLAQYEKPPDKPQQQPVDPYRLAEAIAERRIHQLAFNKAADNLVEKGHEAYDKAEFDGAIRRLQSIGAVFEDDGTPSAVLSAVMDCDAPHDVLMHLGANPEEAERLANMSPRAMIRAVAKLESKLATTPSARVSKAPAPVKPVGGRGGVESGLRDTDDIKSWMERRKAQVAKNK